MPFSLIAAEIGYKVVSRQRAGAILFGFVTRIGALSGVPALVSHDGGRLGQIERPVGRIRGDRGQGMAAIEFVVRQAAVFPPKHHRDGPLDRSFGYLGGRCGGTEELPFGGPFPRGHRDDEDTIAEGLFEGLTHPDPVDDIAGVVGDAFDPIGIEHPRFDQAEVLDPEVLRDPDGARDVDDVLGLDQDENGRGGHPSPMKSVAWPFTLSEARRLDLSTALR